jgi:hypothetical protein
VNSDSDQGVSARLADALIYFGLAAFVIAAGLVLRLVPLRLSAFTVKYGGSVLWAAMVYLLLAGCLPRRRSLTVALIAAAVAALVELSRLYHSPALDAFRLTRAGILLLGRVFSGWHFAIYWATIAIVATADWRVRRRGRIEA